MRRIRAAFKNISSKPKVYVARAWFHDAAAWRYGGQILG
jgi:hypothetical protein